MKTIIYDTVRSVVIHQIDGPYLVDGRPGLVEYPLVKLTEQKTTPPVYNAKTQNISSSWQVQEDKYTEVWTVSNKTTQEMTNEVNADADVKEQKINNEELKKLLRMTANALPETELYKYPSIYPAWKVGVALTVADKIQYNGKLYKVVQAHTTQLDWTPDIVPALFTEIVPEGVIPDWKQPTGAQDAYNIGDKVRFNGMNYQSLINGNVWSPTAYPAGWKLV